MLAKIIDRAGDNNPQIFRELKERLTPRNMAIAIVGSLVIQGLVLLYFYGQLPVPNSANIGAEIRNYYCQFSTPQYYTGDDPLCKINGAGNLLINWQKYFADLFICLSWILPFGLILGSVYMLVTDLVQEEKRGTLNFIRLSPQSAQQIFIGKILGVPILVYIATIFMLPLHLYLGCSAGGNILFVGSWYLAIGSLWFLLASLSVWYVLLGGAQAILTTLVVSYPVWMPIGAINSFALLKLDNPSYENSSNCWFWIPIASHPILFYIFWTICLSIASYWVMQALDRRYLNPTATIISKSQSYRANLCWQIWIAGFSIPVLAQNYDYQDETVFGWLVGTDFVGLSLLMPLLLPSKQALQDWSRYRRERVTQQRRQFWQRELVQDLIYHDKSPALLAIALNIGIATSLWIPVSIFMSFRNFTYGTTLVAGIGLMASLILIYTAIAHLGLFLNVRKRKLWIGAIVAGAILVPMLGAWLLSITHAPSELISFLLLFSPFAGMGIYQSVSVGIFAAFATQLAILAALTRQLQRKLQISGRSQTKEMGVG